MKNQEKTTIAEIFKYLSGIIDDIDMQKQSATLTFHFPLSDIDLDKKVTPKKVKKEEIEP